MSKEDKHDQLREAIKKGDKKTAKQLILNNALADNSHRKSSAHSLLHWAIIKFQDTEIVEILLDQKVGINAKNHRRQTPLDLAVQLDKVRAVKLLLSRGAHIGEDLGLLIHSATTNGNNRIVKLLVNYGVENNLSINLNDSLNLAVEKGFAKIVKCIIPHCTFKKKDKKRISKNIVSKVGQQYNECIDVLLQHGFSVSPGSEKDDFFVYSAVENGYTSIVRELLLLGIDVNMRYEKTGLTLLHAACLNKHLKIAELLVKHQADVNSETIKGTSSQEDNSSSEKKSLVGQTALHIAVDNSDAKLTKLLLYSGATIKDDPNFFTVTSIAVQNECKEIIGVFLKHGVDVNTTDADGNILLHLCSVCEPRSYLFESKSRPSRFNYSTKHDIAELLLRKGANVNAQNQKGETPLFIALRKEYTKMVKVLLKYYANVNHTNANDNTPLHILLETHLVNDELVKLLLDHNAKVNMANQIGRTPLHSASNKWSLKAVQMLLDFNADVNSTDNYGMTPLHCIAESLDLKTMTILLENKANINAKTNDGKTPLHIVCNNYLKYSIKRIKLLLRYNADVNAVDAVGWTPIFYACKNGYIPIVQLLLSNKANVNHVDSSGATPICAAAEISSGEFKVIEFLLDRKSTNVHFVTNEKETLFHILAKHNHVDIVENYFDRINIDINAIDKNGKSALHYAAAKGHREMVVSLLKHGADINIQTEGYPTVLYYTLKHLFRLARDYNRFLRTSGQRSNQASINRMIDLYDRKINTCKKILKIFKEHTIKFKCAGLYVCRQNDTLSYGTRERDNDSSDDNDSDDEDLKVHPRRFEVTCAEEVKQSELVNVGKSNVTLRNLLTRNIHSVAKYAKNESIAQDLKSNNLRGKFPLYIDIIKNRFAEGVRRSKILETAHKNFSSIISHRLSYNCRDEIFSYLHFEDLKTFTEAVKPFKVVEKKISGIK